MSVKGDILTVQEKERAHTGNETKRSLEMTSWKRYIMSHRLKVSKMFMKEHNEKERFYYQI